MDFQPGLVVAANSPPTCIQSPACNKEVSGNDRFNAVCQGALKLAILIAGAGGAEYQEMFQMLKNLLHGWKLNKKIALLELDQKNLCNWPLRGR